MSEESRLEGPEKKMIPCGLVKEWLLVYGQHLSSCPLSPMFKGGGKRAQYILIYHKGFDNTLRCSCGLKEVRETLDK